MKRTVRKEIFIEIETIRVTRKRVVRRKPAPPSKANGSNHSSSIVKSDERPENLFDKFF